MTQKIDKTYVRRFQKGDTSAFEQIYQHYNRQLYYFIFSIVKNTADAEEGLQLTFIRVIKNIQSLKSPEAFHSWLYRIAYNQAITICSKDKHKVNLDDDTNLEEIVYDKEMPDELYIKREIVDLVKDEIEKMPEIYGQVAILKYFDDLTIKEIAEVLGIPTGTVKTRLSIIRENLQPALRSKGISSSRIFSVGLSPFVIQAFYESIISNATLTNIYNNIGNATSGYQIAANAGGIAIMQFFGANAAKILIVMSVVTVGYGTYSVVNEPTTIVEKISYYNSPTNKPIEVTVYLESQPKSYKVSRNSKEITATQGENILTFVADSNGTYSIEVDNFKDNLVISNIDKEGPELKSVSYEEDLLSFDLVDNQSVIDYEKSYIEINEQTYELPQSHKIEGEFTGVVNFHLYDDLQNEKVYEVKITEEVGDSND